MQPLETKGGVNFSFGQRFKTGQKLRCQLNPLLHRQEQRLMWRIETRVQAESFPDDAALLVASDLAYGWNFCWVGI